MTGFLTKTLAFAALISTALGAQAGAQAVCGKRDSIVAQLASKYGETLQSVGLQQGRGVVEIYASEETGSWTIILTDTRGHSCLMAAGEAFQTEKAAKAETPT